MEGTLEELRRISNCPEGATFSQLGLRKSVASSKQNALVGGPFGSNLVSRDYAEDGVPVIRGQNMGQRWIGGEFAYVSREKAEALSANLARPSDVIFTQRVTLGQVSLVPNKPYEHYLISQSQMKLTVDSQKADPLFLYYVFRTPEQQEHIQSHAIQTGVPHTNLGILRSTVVPAPPIAKQKAIARILGSLDDKIELNHRMNETLEAMARALFKSWFVDFDPVRARAEGRDPGLPKPIVDLFPARLVNSELGEIPEGWPVVTLPHVIDVNPTRPLPKGQVAPYLDMANMPAQGHTPDTVIDRPFGSGMRFVNGDTFVARITPCLENGKTAFVDFLERGQIGWGSTEYIVLRPKPPLPEELAYCLLPEELAYCLARSNGFREFAIQSMTGTSGRQRVPAEALSHYRIAAPPKEIGEHFGEVVAPLFARAAAAARESHVLASLRDALLPNLISGELRVEDPSRAVAEAAG